MKIKLEHEDLENALPSLTGTISLDGLEHQVEIYRDQYGVPHMRAQSVRDAFFVQGFVHAQDRLWQMEFDRRRAYGRWAEFAGSTAVPMDLFARRARLGASANVDYAGFSDKTKSMLEAYAEGVNAFIATTDVLPVEYKIVDALPERWQPRDSCAVFKIRHILMGTWQSKLFLARLVHSLEPDAAVKLHTQGHHIENVLIIPSDQVYRTTLKNMDELTQGIEAITQLPELEGGSNSWAVHGSRTASGKPLVAGDPHRQLDVPNVYYQNHLCCPEFDVIGFSFPGVPGFPHFGHNANVAWCITHAMADYQDLYVERFQSQDPIQYMYKNDWLKTEQYGETVHVRDADPVDVEITVTHHGPVVIGDPRKGFAMALRYTATAEPNSTFEALLPMLSAKSVEEFDEAMRPWVDPCNNLIMADVHGTIGYLTRGNVPIRSRANGWLPVPGWTGEHEWQGMIPFKEMPRSLNPEVGYLVTANNRIVGSDYPYYLTLNYLPPYRAKRITDRLDLLDNATTGDMASIHGDRLSIPGKLFVERLKTLKIQDESLAGAIERLTNWDGQMDRESTGANIYIVMRDQLTRLMTSQPKLSPIMINPFEDESKLPTLIPEDWSMMWGVVPTLLDENDTSLLGDGENWLSLLAESLRRAVDWLTGTLGSNMDDWKWGNVHRTIPKHPLSLIYPELGELLNPPSVSIGGDGDTPQAAGISPGVFYSVAYTSVARYIFDLSDWDNSRWIVPLGSSGHPGSRHYSDQAEMWADVQLIPMLYSWEKIIAQNEKEQRLEPKP